MDTRISPLVDHMVGEGRLLMSSILEKAIAADRQILAWIGDHRVLDFKLALMDFSALASGVAVITGTVLIALLLVSARRDREALKVMITSAGAALFYKLIEQIIQRDRPDVISSLIEARGEFSFPSGHALMGSAFYLSLYFASRRNLPLSNARVILSTMLLVIPVLAGISRLYIGVHYPTDVAAGLIIGSTWAWGVEWLFKSKLG